LKQLIDRRRSADVRALAGLDQQRARAFFASLSVPCHIRLT
jgi:hypothetical protein